MRAYLRVILSVTIAVPLFALVACDETIDATKAPAADSGTDAGTDAGPVTSLYQRLGGKAGITAFVDATLTEELKDPEIAAFFADNLKTPPPAGRPTGAQIKGCLVAQISNASSDATKGDPALPYPTKLDDGYQCRDMKTAHTGLGISEAVFNKFGAIATGVAKAGGKLSDADLKAVGDFLNLNKPAIVSAPVVDGGTDTGTDTGIDTGILDAATDG